MNFLKQLIEYINGDFAYKNYLKIFNKKNCQKTPLSKKDFLRQKEQRKWQKINRCC